jgi:hypothetical protein
VEYTTPSSSTQWVFRFTPALCATFPRTLRVFRFAPGEGFLHYKIPVFLINETELKNENPGDEFTSPGFGHLII